MIRAGYVPLDRGAFAYRTREREVMLLCPTVGHVDHVVLVLSRWTDARWSGRSSSPRGGLRETVQARRASPKAEVECMLGPSSPATMVRPWARRRSGTSRGSRRTGAPFPRADGHGAGSEEDAGGCAPPNSCAPARLRVRPRLWPDAAAEADDSPEDPGETLEALACSSIPVTPAGIA